MGTILQPQSNGPGPISERAALDALMPLVYAELHGLAACYMGGERAGHTLQPTALVNEIYLRLLQQHSLDFSNRSQVVGVAAQMMRRVLRKHDETRRAAKRGGGATLICLSDAPEPAGQPPVEFGDVDVALDSMARLDARQAMVVELRIFGGLTVAETAEFLGISLATVHRDWATGKIWLTSELRKR